MSDLDKELKAMRDEYNGLFPGGPQTETEAEEQIKAHNMIIKFHLIQMVKLGAVLVVILLCGCLTVLYLTNKSSVDDCEKAHELYKKETKVYQSDCYVKTNGKWKEWNGLGEP